jgi:hypothetical protein
VVVFQSNVRFSQNPFESKIEQFQSVFPVFFLGKKDPILWLSSSSRRSMLFEHLIHPYSTVWLVTSAGTAAAANTAYGATAGTQSTAIGAGVIRTF